MWWQRHSELQSSARRRVQAGDGCRKGNVQGSIAEFKHLPTLNSFNLARGRVTQASRFTEDMIRIRCEADCFDFTIETQLAPGMTGIGISVERGARSPGGATSSVKDVALAGRSAGQNTFSCFVGRAFGSGLLGFGCNGAAHSDIDGAIPECTGLSNCSDH
jgi:hypothetical protein